MNILYSSYWPIAVTGAVVLAIGDLVAIGFGFGVVADSGAVAIYCVYFSVTTSWKFN